MKWCSRCERLKLNSEFHRNAARADGRQNWCKECVKNPEYQASYYLANRARLLPGHNEAAWRWYFRMVGIPTGEDRRDR